MDQLVRDRDPEDPSRARVLLLGSSDLSRELVIALQRLGAEVIVVDRHAGGPLQGIADQPVVADLADTDELAATIGRLRPDVVVTAAGVPVTDALAGAAAAEMVPDARAARLAADEEQLRRLAADELGLPTAPFWFAGSVDELRAVAEHAGFPMVVRPVTGRPGEGRSVMLRADDVEPAWQRAVGAPGSVGRVLAETVVEIDVEVTLLTVRSDGPGGPAVDFCAPIGRRSVEGADRQVELEFWQPQALSKAALGAAKSIAARVVRALGGRGLFGVELAVRGDEVYFTGVTVRPYDAAWVTLRTQRLSGFELQARAILGLAVDTIMISPGAARLIYTRHQGGRAPGHARPDVVAVPADALKVTESDVMVFGYDEGRPRRLGLAVATGSDVRTARNRARQVSAALDRTWHR